MSVVLIDCVQVLRPPLIVKKWQKCSVDPYAPLFLIGSVWLSLDHHMGPHSALAWTSLIRNSDMSLGHVKSLKMSVTL